MIKDVLIGRNLKDITDREDFSLENWPDPDVGTLSKDDLDRFLKRKEAVILYMQGTASSKPGIGLYRPTVGKVTPISSKPISAIDHEPSFVSDRYGATQILANACRNCCQLRLIGIYEQWTCMAKSSHSLLADLATRASGQLNP